MKLQSQKPYAPKHLSSEMKAFWNAILRDYAPDDRCGIRGALRTQVPAEPYEKRAGHDACKDRSDREAVHSESLRAA